MMDDVTRTICSRCSREIKKTIGTGSGPSRVILFAMSNASLPSCLPLAAEDRQVDFSGS